MNKAIYASLAVGAGGAIGSLARYGLSLLGQRFSFSWPLGTLAANILGCFFIGLITELATRGENISPSMRLFLATGFCGGFTTMSSLIYETAQMAETQEHLHASLYLGATLLFSMLAFWGGIIAVRFAIKSAEAAS